ncbi:undecaprenyl-phosphate glucose phosphotransferase [Chitinophaga nivalis]|uniref:Undecaprenyl-phosphate glucose phosphotransferase n=1 Tax=Chitinophaga nivalis TaxID=2991709 RepID=A0ABT3IEP3_9BACT|nr:undecaprenyl-phosphate glucose phosphotransferase [Chitinophaga nivalis]MCW3467879.1 undecaprenyl-phosphate glucose phosphotransferase [Chitinophaga nivalis]MCW3482430.1 undecaprenyl-phosphate glucose phosphotransferase [Chitinophaga nivalis]
MKPNINTNELLRQVTDYVILALAFILARHYVDLQPGAAAPSFRMNLLLLSVSALTWAITGIYVHLYDDFRSRPFAYEFVAILKTVVFHSFIFIFLFFFFFKSYPYSRTFTLIYTINIFAGITLSKLLVKKLLRRLRTFGHNTKNVLIVGAGETGLDFHQTITQNDQFGYKCIGFIDDQTNTMINGQYLGSLSDLKNILEDHEIDDVVVALPESSREQTENIILTSEKAAKRVRIIADCHRYCTPTVRMSLFGTFPLITIRSSPLDDNGRQQLKRIFDIGFTLFLLITFSWLFVLIALLIKVSSPGPVIFKQERWGLKNKKITCYKFRTMVRNSETGPDGQFRATIRNDSRITAIGRFLRKTNLDELPQFINVLMGDMSFVGPRPHAIPIHLEMKDTIEHYMLRHLVKPGITGWAQVNGYRGDYGQSGHMQRRIDLDLWYIENYSFWLDCQIIFQTLVNMIRGDENAI